MLTILEGLNRLWTVKVMLGEESNGINVSPAELIKRRAHFRYLESICFLFQLYCIQIAEDDFSYLRMCLKQWNEGISKATNTANTDFNTHKFPLKGQKGRSFVYSFSPKDFPDRTRVSTILNTLYRAHLVSSSVSFLGLVLPFCKCNHNTIWMGFHLFSVGY